MSAKASLGDVTSTSSGEDRAQGAESSEKLTSSSTRSRRSGTLPPLSTNLSDLGPLEALAEERSSPRASLPNCPDSIHIGQNISPNKTSSTAPTTPSRLKLSTSWLSTKDALHDGDESSDKNSPIMIAAAQQARINRASMVFHRRPSDVVFSDNEHVGLASGERAEKGPEHLLKPQQEITPSIPGNETPEHDPTMSRPSSEYSAKSNEHGPDAVDDIVSKSRNASSSRLKSYADSVSSSARFRLSRLKPLGSHPIPAHDSLPNETKVPVKRSWRTTFAAPSLTIGPWSKHRKDEIIITPYPRDETRKRHDRNREDNHSDTNDESDSSDKGEYEASLAQDEKSVEDREESSVLPIILRRLTAQSSLRLGRVVIPRAKLVDDEALSALVWNEYANLAGWSARWGAFRLANVSIVSPAPVASSRSFHLRSASQEPAAAATGDEEIAWLELLRNPTRGRGAKSACAKWIPRGRRLAKRPMNGKGIAGVDCQPALTAKESEKAGQVALQLEQGWSPAKIGIAVGTMIFLSFIAVLFWTLFGYGPVTAIWSVGIGQPRNAGWRGAGGRVETALILGLIVLFFGWTIVGAWILLSWACS